MNSWGSRHVGKFSTHANLNDFCFRGFCAHHMRKRTYSPDWRELLIIPLTNTNIVRTMGGAQEHSDSGTSHRSVSKNTQHTRTPSCLGTHQPLHSHRHDHMNTLDFSRHTIECSERDERNTAKKPRTLSDKLRLCTCPASPGLLCSLLYSRPSSSACATSSMNTHCQCTVANPFF